MQIEKDCLTLYNEFLHILYFEIKFQKIVGALLVFEILDNNLYLYPIDFKNFLFLFLLFH